MSVPESTFTVDEIQNTGANTDPGNNFCICQISGWRYKPGELKRQWDGLWVGPDRYTERHPQDFIKVRAESLTGSKRPEGSDTFISTAVTQDDL